MVLPPNRVGALRGPNGSTLDTLAALLENLNVTASDVLMAVQALAADTAASALALSDLRAVLYALARNLGQTGDPPLAVPGLGVLAQLDAIRAGVLQVSAGVGLADDVMSDSVYVRLDVIAAALTSELGENVYGRLGTLRDNSEALLAAVGTLPGDPAGETVKTLLSALVECCNDVPVGEVFEPPATNCNAQAITWQECTLVERFDQGSGGNRVFAVVFPGGIAGFPDLGALTLTSPEGEQALGSLTAGDLDFLQYDVCIAWSFSVTTPLFNYAIQVDALPVGGPFNSYTGQTPPVDNPGGEYTNFFVRDLANVNYVLRANFAFDTGVTPIGKVWIGAAGVGEF